MEYLKELLSFFPKSTFEELGLETGIDKHSKKLQGELIFKLLLYCILTDKQTSLRGMVSAFESSVFRAFYDGPENVLAHSSISDRLSTIKPEFFEKLYYQCVNHFNTKHIKLANRVVKYDSTIVAYSAKLLKIGYNIKGGGADKLRMLKFTVGYSSIPECVCFYTDDSSTSENKALKETIVSEHAPSKTTINVFDRGISSRKIYDLFNQENIKFVSRLNKNADMKIHVENALKKEIETNTLIITKDEKVFLYDSRKTKIKHPLRVITAIRKENREEITFVTNINNLTASEITEIYKSRWEIEVFFKFLKQQLNFRHLLNRTQNGIKVILYVTMIAAILLTQYKKDYKLTGFKIAKKRFSIALENNIIYNLIIVCGGNKEKAKMMVYGDTS